jgi:hypothetical protein
MENNLKITTLIIRLNETFRSQNIEWFLRSDGEFIDSEDNSGNDNFYCALQIIGGAVAILNQNLATLEILHLDDPEMIAAWVLFHTYLFRKDTLDGDMPLAFRTFSVVCK